MHRQRRIFSLFLALSLCLSMGVSALEPAEAEVAVQFNGEMLDQAGAVLVGGVTFIPQQNLFAALGGETDRTAEGAISAVRDGISLTLIPGGSELIVARDGEESVLPLRAAPYLAPDGSLYVPLRDLCEALGTKVFWDNESRAALILDVDRLVEEVGGEFTLLDKLIHGLARTEPAGAGVNHLLSALLSGRFSGEDEAVAFGLEMSGLMSEAAMQMEGKLTLDLSQVSESELAGLEKMEYSGRMILNQEEGKLYLNVPDLNAMLGQQVENGWISLDVSEYIAARQELLELGQGWQLTGVGSLLHLMFDQTELYTVESYGWAVEDNLDGLRRYAGDQRFTREGDKYVFSLKDLTGDGLFALDLSFAVDEKDALTEYAATLEIKEEGGMLRAELQGTPDTAWVNLVFALEDEWQTISLTLDADYAEGQGKLNLRLDYDDGDMAYALSLEMTLTPTDEEPAGAPPQGDPVVDMTQDFPGPSSYDI